MDSVPKQARRATEWTCLVSVGSAAADCELGFNQKANGRESLAKPITARIVETSDSPSRATLSNLGKNHILPLQSMILHPISL